MEVNTDEEVVHITELPIGKWTRDFKVRATEKEGKGIL